MKPFPIDVIAPSLGIDPVSWVHWFEARKLTKELSKLGFTAQLLIYHKSMFNEPEGQVHLLRLHDNKMVQVAQDLTSLNISYSGPSYRVLNSCYDKLAAYEIVQKNRILCPGPEIGDSTNDGSPALLVKPRRESDSLGIRVFKDGIIPSHWRTRDYLVQHFIQGIDMTVACFRTFVGTPLRILRPDGSIYSFARKNLMRTPRKPVIDSDLRERIRRIASIAAHVFNVNWAARNRFAVGTGSG